MGRNFLILFSILGSLVACSSAKPTNPTGLGLTAETAHIIGGNEVSAGDPLDSDVAELQYTGSDAHSQVSGYCTATHISDDVLLTAAHCFARPGFTLGSASVTYTSKHKVLFFSVADTREVVTIKVHPDYPANLESDLALIKIKGQRPEAQRVLSLNFQVATTLASQFPITAIGYGITDKQKDVSDPGTGGEVLRTTSLQVMDFDSAQTAFHVDISQGHGINEGDSGGPALVNENGQLEVIGIARNVFARHHGDMQIFDQKGTYTNLKPFQDWIESTLSTLETP